MGESRRHQALTSGATRDQTHWGDTEGVRGERLTAAAQRLISSTTRSGATRYRAPQRER